MAQRSYLLITNRPVAGMFASFIQVIGERYYCEQKDITPVVFFGSNWVYWQPGGYLNSINGWEYYFNPLSDVNISQLVGRSEEYLQYCNIFDYDNKRIIANKNPKHIYNLSRRGHLALSENITVVNRWPEFNLGVRSFCEGNRKIACRLVNDYIKVKPSILAKVERFYRDKMLGFTVIGVHLRGPSHNGEIEGWHKLSYADEKYYFAEVDRILELNPAARILIASDVSEVITSFEGNYGEKCIYLDAIRSTLQQGAPCHELGGALTGEEVLIEALCLARTDFFIHGISNVAYGVLCFNESLPHLDVYQKNEEELHRSYLKKKPEYLQ